MKDIEQRLIAELMRNCRRNDKELAKAIGSSRATVARVRTKLEKEGVVQGYAMVPDFSKIGFPLMSFTFARMKEQIPENAIRKTKEQISEMLGKMCFTYLLSMGGEGYDADRVVLAVHENYSAYSSFLQRIKQHPLVKIDDVKSFIVSLPEASHSPSITFKELAKYVAQKVKKPTSSFK